MIAKVNALREVQSSRGMLSRKGTMSVLRTHEVPECSEWQGRAFKGEM
jgi:hypothetical protein